LISFNERGKCHSIRIAQKKCKRYSAAGNVRLKPPDIDKHEEVLLAIFCNDPITREWKILKVRRPYACRPGELCQEVKSWIKQESGRELDEEDLSYWCIYDDAGQVDPNLERIVEQQHHFVLNAQEKASSINKEEGINIRDPRGPVKRFLRIGKRRKTCKYKKKKVEARGIPHNTIPRGKYQGRARRRRRPA
jgi:hypothetical protein